MKVLLFVQTGDARPKCSGRAHRAPGRDGRFWHNLGGTGWNGTARMTTQMATRDRWWLVECANAEAGRRVIEVWIKYGHSCDPARFAHTSGRILASGGKR